MVYKFNAFLGNLDLVNENVKLPSYTSNPEGQEEGTMILNTSTHTVNIYYLGDWKILHTISVATEYILLENGEFMLQETGDKIIK